MNGEHSYRSSWKQTPWLCCSAIARVHHWRSREHPSLSSPITPGPGTVLFAEPFSPSVMLMAALRCQTLNARPKCRMLLLVVVRRHYAWQKHGQRAFVISAPQHFEHHILSGLQFRHGLLVVVQRSDWFAIDFRDHVPAAEAQVVGKARWVDIGHQHASLAFHAHARRTIRCEAVHAQTEFSRRSFTGLIPYAPGLRRKHPRAIFHHRSGFFRRAVAYVVQLHLAADRSLRNGIHQVVSGLHRLAVHGGDHVTAL